MLDNDNLRRVTWGNGSHISFPSLKHWRLKGLRLNEDMKVFNVLINVEKKCKLCLFLHFAAYTNISRPNCPESFYCPGLTPFQYPFFNVTDTRCGLIKINCTSKGGEIQLGGQSYEITGKLDSHNIWSDAFFIIRNTTLEALEQLVNNQSCEALMNDLIPESPHPLLYSISIRTFITVCKCTKNFTYPQQTDAYFDPRGYKRYNTCNDYIFYYNYLNGTVPSDLPHTCQVVRLPAILPNTPGLDETNIFSVISYYPSIFFNLSSACDDCYKKGQRCDTKNGAANCSDVIKEIQDTKPTPSFSKQEKHGWTWFKIFGVLGVPGCVTILIIILLCLKRKARRGKKAKHNVKVEMFLKNHEFITPKRYSYSEVVKMTNSFKVKLGQGGFGSVYKGVLKNQKPVAVKVLSEIKGDGQDFINEVASVGRTSHVNIVSLVGFCLEGRQRALIYEFMPNGSLERFIYSRGSSSSSQLGWEKLHEISIGIARGLEYLHKGCNTRILHFDIKPHNILLDKDFCPKISDFGLAKLFHEKESKISMSHMRGTPEMVGGRKNIEVEVDHTSEIYFPHWIYKKVELHEEQLGLAMNKIGL
ncbi:hypothetical protein R6Q59_005353 [Mikania micrantha]